MNERSDKPRPDKAQAQQTGRLLEEWLRDEAPVHEPPVLIPTVRARVALTRRRPGWLIRDWWRWRPGRSRKGFRKVIPLTRFIAVTVLALSGAGLFMVANGGPTADPAPPAAVADLDPEEVIARVSGTITGTVTDEGRITINDIGFVHEGMVGRGTSHSDDPRLTGDIEMTFNWVDFLPQDGSGVSAKSFPIHISNEDGAWGGVLEGIRYPDEVFGDSHTAGPLAGSGGYEGLVAFLFLEGDNSNYSFEGVIYPADGPE